MPGGSVTSAESATVGAASRLTGRAVALALAVTACGAPSREAPLAVGDPWPLPQPDHAAAVAWTFGTEHCYSCTSFAGDIRRAQRELGVTVLVLPVDVEPRLVASTLAAERISATTLHLTAADYRRLFGPSPHPVAYVVRDGRVAAVWRAQTPPGTDSTRAPLADVVERALRPGGSFIHPPPGRTP